MNKATSKPQTASAPSAAKDTDPQGKSELGPEHAEIAKCVGTWDVAFTMWTQEGAPPVKSTARAIFSPVFNGRFIREDYTGEFLGKPFTGVGTLGYDRAAGHFVSMWYDSVSTGIMHSTALPGISGEDLTFEGVGVCQETGEEQSVRHVMHKDSDNRFILSFYRGEGDDEKQAMELVYTRRN